MSTPNIHEEARIAQGAIVVGDVTLKKGANVWYNAVLRGDVGKIVIGENSNIQDCATVHVSGFSETILGDYVTVGHNAVVHGCQVGDNTLIGMGAVILDNAVIGKNCIIAAGALVPMNMVIPDNSLVIGSPAKVRRETTEADWAANHENAAHYVINPMPTAK